MPLDRCGDWAGLRQPFHRSLAGQGGHPPTYEKKQPIFHPEPKARGECSPFKFQSVSITPVSIPRTSGLSRPPPPITAPLLPLHQPSAVPSVPGFQAYAYRREGEEGASRREAWLRSSLFCGNL